MRTNFNISNLIYLIIIFNSKLFYTYKDKNL